MILATLQTKAEALRLKNLRRELVMNKVESSPENREFGEAKARMLDLWQATDQLKEAMNDVAASVEPPGSEWVIHGDDANVTHEILLDLQVSVKSLMEAVLSVHKLLFEKNFHTRVSQLCFKSFDVRAAEMEMKLLQAYRLGKLLGKVSREGRRVLESRRINWTRAPLKRTVSKRPAIRNHADAANKGLTEQNLRNSKKSHISDGHSINNGNGDRREQDHAGGNREVKFGVSSKDLMSHIRDTLANEKDRPMLRTMSQRKLNKGGRN